MPTTHITKRNIDTLRKQTIDKILSTGVKEIVLWDQEVTGLGLRIGKSGKASWLVYRRFRNGGEKAKQVVTAFGSLAEYDLEQARGKARSILEGIRNGANPNSDKRSVRNEDREAFRNGKLEPLLNEWQVKAPKDGYYGYEVGRMIKVDVIPTLGASTLVRDVTRKNVLGLLDSKSPSVSRSLFALLRPFFKWCVEREVIAKSPLEGMVAPKRVDARERVLSDEELVLVWNAACSLPYPWGPFYKLLVLTAQRRDEVADLPWSELDLVKRLEWIIPGKRTKNGKEHLVHLSGWATDILRSSEAKGGDTLVFTTAKREGLEVPVSGFSKAKLLIDKRIKELNNDRDMEPWRIHDLRRTAATGMGALGVPPHIVERILNHVSGVNAGIVGVYQRFEYVIERREALKSWANHINELVLDSMQKERENMGNVLTLRGR